LEELAALKNELNNERSNTGGTAVPLMEHEKALFDLKRLEKQKVGVAYHIYFPVFRIKIKKSPSVEYKC
jgi:hypothetical protein